MNETEALIRACLPPRKKDGHKGTYGRAHLLCGSETYTGAAHLAAGGAVRMGAGLVFLHAPEAALTPVRATLPEVICRRTLPLAENPAVIAEIAAQEREGAFLIGPGLGRGEAGAFSHALTLLLSGTGGAALLDADALNTLALLHDRGVAVLRSSRRPLVLTPHPLEFSRLTGKTVSEIMAARESIAAAYARENRVTLILKGSGSVIADRNGRVTVNESGTPALAKGGSGDVLAGMIVGLLAQGVPPYKAARIGAYLHGRAGERLAARYSEYGILPSELAATAAEVLADILA